MDSETEEKIQKALNILTTDKTTIVIAHRLSTIKKANRIYYLNQGRILEAGTFEELVASLSGEFRKTAELQGII